MASIPEPHSTPCQFTISWQGKCGKKTDNGWCNKHEHLKCVSCGEKAVQECDETMGSLVCGVSLCATCKHVRGGRHITEEEYKKMQSEEEAEQAAKEASWLSPNQRLNENGIPVNLFELKKSMDGYVLEEIYLLELKHGLMGFFPAIISENKEMVITDNKSLICDVWKRLEPRESRLIKKIGYVGKGVVFPDAGTDVDIIQQGEISPVPLLTKAIYSDLVSKETKSNPAFRWAPGLIGGRYLSQDSFFNLISSS